MRNKTFADRSFAVASPKLWNDLSYNIKYTKKIDDFKHQLKNILLSFKILCPVILQHVMLLFLIVINCEAYPKASYAHDHAI